MREELAAAAVATLYLVADEDGVVLVAKLTKCLQEVGLHHADAAHALYALHDAGTHIALLYLAFPRPYVVERQIGDVSVSIDWRDDFRVVRCLDGQRGAAVEGFLQGEDAGAAVEERRQLQRVLVGLCAAVDEEKAVVLVAASLAEPSRQFLLQGVLHGVAVEAERLQLSRHGLHIMRMAMAYTDNGVTAIKVEVLLALAVPHFATLATRNGHIHQRVNVE